MALAVQQSLFEADGGTPMVEFARWIEGVMLGEIALGVCVIAVALIGALMLTGHLPLRESARVMVGCFVLLGAPVIAAGVIEASNRNSKTSAQLLHAAQATQDLGPGLPPASFDPYAGASFGRSD